MWSDCAEIVTDRKMLETSAFPGSGRSGTEKTTEIKGSFRPQAALPADLISIDSSSIQKSCVSFAQIATSV
jgi:hypothetical protein